MQVNGTEQEYANGMYTKPVGNQELGKTEFLQLLVTQLKHQDPLQPMSNSEFVAQLAQFSSVEQLVAVNEGVNMLGMQQMSMSNSQAASLIGREVQLRSDKLQVKDGDTSVSAAFRLDADASEVKVNFRDSAGKLVRTMEMGSATRGEVDIAWDCRDDNGVMVPPGTFRIDVQASDADGNSVTWEAKVRGEVTGVNYDAGYPELIVGTVKADMSDILGVFPISAAVP